MLRFIVRADVKHGSGYVGSSYKTIDLAVPELERELTRGGFDEDRYDLATLVGVEILIEKQADADV